MIDTSPETVGRYAAEANAIGRAHFAAMFSALAAERDAYKAALDATWKAACEAMREEAARTAKVAWLSAPYDEIADADAMNTVCTHAEELICNLPTPERPR